MSVIITNFAHGTTTDNENDISTGWNDAPLSEVGIEQSTTLADLIKEREFDVVYHSDLTRAADTAKLALGDRDLAFIADKRLRECNYGNLNGGPVATVEPMYDKCIDVPFPEGESMKDVEARIAAFLTDMQVKHPGQKIAVVSHKGPQLALEVLLNNKTWGEAIATDWRVTKAWQPGWEYTLE